MRRCKDCKYDKSFVSGGIYYEHCAIMGWYQTQIGAEECESYKLKWYIKFWKFWRSK